MDSVYRTVMDLNRAYSGKTEKVREQNSLCIRYYILTIRRTKLSGDLVLKSIWQMQACMVEIRVVKVQGVEFRNYSSFNSIQDCFGAAYTALISADSHLQIVTYKPTIYLNLTLAPGHQVRFECT